MAITGTNRGTGTNTTGATTVVITPGQNFTAGSHAVLVLAYDNAGASGADPYSSIIDSVGNTWIPRQAGLYDPGAASAGVTIRIFSCPMLAAALTTSNTITVSFGANTVASKSWTLTEMTCTAGSILRFITGSVNAGAASATPTVTTSSITSGDIVFGAGASESGDTWVTDGDTSSGNWSTFQHTAAGTGATGMAVTSQFKVVSGTAAQTYNPTLTSADVILVWAQFREVVATMAANTATFVLTGNTTGLVRGRKITADAATFALTGNSTALRRTWIMTAAATSYAMTGNDTLLKYGRQMIASAGSYVVTGSSVNLLRALRLPASAGVYALTGNDAGLLRTRILIAAAGTFEVTGYDATLTYQPVGGSVMTAGPGTFVLNGNDASLVRTYILSPEPGAFVLLGNDAVLSVQSSGSGVLSCESASFVLTGNSAVLTSSARPRRSVGKIKQILYTEYRSNYSNFNPE